MRTAKNGWLFIPSPLLGAASWAPVVDAMTELDQPSAIVETTMTTTVDYDHITPWVNEILTAEPPAPELPTVVVAHSAACPRMPLVVDQLVHKGWSIDAMILVDGRFPTGQAFTVSVPEYGEMLDGMVRPDDYLPPWPRWWGSLVSGLVVDPIARDLVFNEAAPVPRTWFDQACPVPDLPPTVGRGFLSFGPGYAEACEQAHEAGWLTMRLNGDHLHQVVAPKPVALTLMAMVAGMSCGRGYPDLPNEPDLS